MLKPLYIISSVISIVDQSHETSSVLKHLLSLQGVQEKRISFLDKAIARAQYFIETSEESIGYPIDSPNHICEGSCLYNFHNAKKQLIELFSAARAGSLIRVKSYFTDYPDLVDFRDEKGQTILHKAVFAKNPTLIVMILSKYPALAPIEDNSYKNPLHYALEGNPLKVGLFLKVAYGGNPSLCQKNS